MAILYLRARPVLVGVTALRKMSPDLYQHLISLGLSDLCALSDDIT